MALVQSKANWALAAVTTGFLASYPFSHTFTGGLVSSTCGAAMVGGIADWFAITALFRRPLGITWRTELIPRNREKILSIIEDMIGQELLTAANMKQTLGRYNLAALFIHYLNEWGGAQQGKEILQAVAIRFAAHADRQELSRSVHILIRQELHRLKLSPLLAGAIEWSLHSGYGDKVITFLIDECRRLGARKEVRLMLETVFSSAQLTYEQGMVRRQLFNAIAAAVAGVTPERGAAMAQQEILRLLEGWREPSHPMRLKMKTWLLKGAAELRSNSRYQATVEKWKDDVLAKPGFVQDRLITAFQQIVNGDGDISWEERLAEWIGSGVDKEVERFGADEALQQQFDREAKALLVRWIDDYHGELAALARQQLDKLSAADLAAFVETRAGDDLQMIRINGSVVGGLLGLVLHSLTWWLR